MSIGSRHCYPPTDGAFVNSPFSRPRAAAPGFTMIEMLVTLTVFSLALSTLVLSLRTGINTYRAIERSQAHEGEAARIRAILSEDLRHLAIVSDEEPFLIEESQETGQELLQFTRLGNRNAQQYRRGAVWSRVQYEVVKGDDGAKLIRREIPFVAAGPLEGAESESVLLEGAESVAFDYFDGQQWRPAWEDAERAPLAVKMTVEPEAGPSWTFSATVPMGLLNAAAGQ